MAIWFYWVNSEQYFVLHCYDNNANINLLSKIRPFSFYYIVTITEARWSYWINTEQYISTALLRSQLHKDLTEYIPSTRYLLHFYDHKGTMILLSKLRAFCSYCSVTITMPWWTLWVNFQKTFLLIYCAQHGAIILFSKLRALILYCIGTITMLLWSYWL
jgi:hypothetical protein